MSLLSNYVDMLTFFKKEVDSVVIVNDKKNIAIPVASELLIMTIEHAKSIRLLLSKKHYASAAALRRVIFETYMRAMWVLNYANSTEIKRFVERGEISKDFKTLIKEVEKSHKLPTFFSKIREKLWYDLLCGFSHNAAIQFEKNTDGSIVRHYYDEKDINEIVEFVGMVTFFAFESVLDLANNKSKKEVMYRLLKVIKPFIKASSYYSQRSIEEETSDM